MGVNLPCYLVILKGTTAWTDNGFHEYADLEVMQMLGRAGRPQFETSACAVILTRKEKVFHYERMVSGEEVLESCLHRNLIEHLNAEIGLGTVRDLRTAKQWLAGTFLYVRLQKNPSHYRFKEDIDNSNEDELLEQLCKKDICLLHDAGFIDRQPQLASTVYGEAMARYYVNFDTMKSFMALPPKAKTSEIVRKPCHRERLQTDTRQLLTLSQAREFREVRMQAGEKSFYKEINKAPEIKFPVKVDIALPAHKVSLLIQAELGNVAIPDGENYRKHHQQHRHDKFTVFAQANRLIRCIIDCQIHLKDATSTRHALELGRSLAARVWDNTASQLRQIEGLGEVAVRKLASASINSIDTLLNTEPSRIELVLGKKPPFGLELLKKLESFPNLRVSVKETRRGARPGRGVTLSFVAEIGFLNVGPPRSFKKKQQPQLYVCFLAETADGDLVDFRRISAKNVGTGEEIFLTLQLTRPTSHIKCYVMCDEVAGTSKYAELPLSGIPDSIYPRLGNSGNTGINSRGSSDNRSNGTAVWDEEFDDEGINDQDLLSMEAHGEPTIEVIEDIDSILHEDSKHQTKSAQLSSTGARQTSHERDEDADTFLYREPIRLRNGRWTCQHDCKERNRKCKHKCCTEGVTKPKRRPKTDSNFNGEEKTQTILTSVTTGKSEARPVSQKTRAPEKLQRPRQRSDSDSVSMSGNGCSGEPAHKRTKLAADQALTDDRHERSNSKPLFDSAQESSPDIQSAKIKAHSPHWKSTNYADGDDALFDFSTDGVERVDADPSATNDARFDETNDNTVASEIPEEGWMEQDPFPDFTTSDFDLGGLEPPLEHVAMSDVQKSSKGLFITGFSSSPLKTPTRITDKVETEEDCFVTMSDHDESLTTLVGTINPDCQLDLPCDDPLKSEANTPTEIMACTPAETEAHPIAEPGEHFAATVPPESEDDRQQRLYEEDQKKRWEGIDQWIYDAFHEYVELV